MDEEVEKLKKALIFAGFTQVAAEEQIVSLNEIISIKISNKLAEIDSNYPDTDDANIIRDYLNDHALSAESMASIKKITIESVYDYVEAIKSELTEESQATFSNMIFG